MLFASITLLGLDWHLLTFLTPHFQYKKAGFFYLIHYWMQASTRNWLHTGGINIKLRCLEKAWNFQRFLYSQSGLHQWLTWRLLKVNCKMQIIFYPHIHTFMARPSSQYSNNLNIQYIHYFSLPYFLFPFCSCFILLLYFSFCFYIFYISSYYFIYTCLAHLFFILYSLSYMRSIFFIFIPYFFFVSRGIFYFLSN